MRNSLILPLVIFTALSCSDFLNGIYDKVEYTTWSVTSNLAVTSGAYLDDINWQNLVVHNGYVYIAGQDESFGSNSRQWRIEKRDSNTGALVNDFEDHTSNHETGGAGVIPGIVQCYISNTYYGININQLILNNGYLFGIGGNWFTTEGMNWRIEKRNILTGKLVSDFGSSGVVRIDPEPAQNSIAYGACFDSEYIYITGTCPNSGGSACDWWTAKHSISTGAQVMSFGGSGLTAGYSQPYAGIITDGSYLYIGGNDYYLTVDSQCRVEKRNKTTGTLVTDFNSSGIYQNDLSTSNDYILNMALDGDYLYLCGYESTSPAKAFVIKLNKNTGVSVSDFGASGVVTKNSTDPCSYSAILVEGNRLYLVGSYKKSGIWIGMIERLNKNTGAPDASFGTGGTILDDTTEPTMFSSAAIDGDYLYVAGTYEDAGGDTRMYIQKRRKDTGGF